MSSSLQVIVADHQPESRVFYQSVLPTLGHKLLSVAQSGQNLIDCCRTLSPDLVIAESKLPDMDVLEASVQVCQARRIPLVVAASQFDPQLIERDVAGHIWAYLIKPIQRGQLEGIISFVCPRFQRMQALWHELASLRLQTASNDT